MNLICLDAEFADAREILELAIYGFDESLIYRSLFKPANTRQWRSSERVHHISPAMVADKPSFASCRHDIQRIVDEADYVVGFAVDNDVRMLERSGIKGFDKRTVVDVRDIYWHCIARDKGFGLYNVPGLAACAADLGITFDQAGEEHSAGADTLVTLRCLKALMAGFATGAEAGAPASDGGDDALLQALLKATDDDKRRFRRENARGYIHLIRGSCGYVLKASASERLHRDDIVATIAVDHRDRAEVDLMMHFAKKAVRGEHRIYDLRDRDIAYFKAYTNTYDEENYDLYRAYNKRF